MSVALCHQYLHAESEDQVATIVDSTSSSHELTWHPLDRRATNFNVVTNQAATGGKALTELCTNMVDAIILRCANEAAIDPLAPSAPRSVVHAVRDLVQLHGARSGILAEVDDPKNLREYAESNLVIGITGETGSGARPCFTFVDSGEGQHPENFENTFLSLSAGLKSKIPFVQGKYNMGSSGVLSFCGRRWYKLIVSRRYDKSGRWGWTLVRRRPVEGPPVAEYLKINSEIPTFDAKSLFPLRLASGKPDRKVERDSGTIVKLYSYNLGRPADFRRIPEALNEGLVSTILPFRLMDYRIQPRRGRQDRRAQGVDERTISGMEYQIRQAKGAVASKFSHRIHVAELQHPDLGKVDISALLLPDPLPIWITPRYNRSRVYHAVNGQVQHKQSRAFVNQCGLPGLKDRVVVLVDASGLKESAHNDIWKGDRETIRRTEIGNLYAREVKHAIRSSRTLSDLQRAIRQKELESYQKKTQVDLFESIVATDVHIAQLLPGGELVQIPSHRASGGIAKEKGEYQGKYSPSYVKHTSRKLSERGIDIVVGERRRIRFETDAVNNWLTRPDNRGSITLEGSAGQELAVTSALQDGSVAVTVHLGADVDSGTILDGALTLKDSAMPIGVTESVRFRVVTQRTKKKSGRRSGSQKHDSETPGDMVTRKGLPRTEWLTKDGRKLEGERTKPWPEDYSEYDGGFVNALGDDEYIYMINYDNAHFQTFLDKENNMSEKKVIAEQYRLSMLVMMLSFEDAYSRSDDKDRLGEVIDEYRRLAARASATVIMSITRTLPDMVTSRRLEELDDE